MKNCHAFPIVKGEPMDVKVAPSVLYENLPWLFEPGRISAATRNHIVLPEIAVLATSVPVAVVFAF